MAQQQRQSIGEQALTNLLQGTGTGMAEPKWEYSAHLFICSILKTVQQQRQSAGEQALIYRSPGNGDKYILKKIMPAGVLVVKLKLINEEKE